MKAVLSTSDTSTTPKIKYIRLEGATLDVSNLVVTDMTGNPPEQNLPTSQMPVSVRKGSEVAFSIDTVGFAETVEAEIGGETVVMAAVYGTDKESNTWVGTFAIPVDCPGDTVYDVRVTARRGTRQRRYEAVFLVVDGTVLEDYTVRLTW